MELSLAPLQSYTEYPFRNAMHHFVGGIDKYYSPFLRLENDKSLKSKYIKDIHPDNNAGIPLIPQILVNSTADFLYLAQLLSDFGYPEINWNLGCPYPMVAKRKLGSGLIPYPNDIVEILEHVVPKIKPKVSIKIRAGYESPGEIIAVLKAIAHLPLAEIILHPRLGKQMYKGHAELAYFTEAKNYANLAYNGDIGHVDQFMQLTHQLPDLSHVMIGRGLLANPFLALEIKSPALITASDKRQKFESLHRHLWEHYLQSLSGSTQVLHKMTLYWEYFSQLFEDSKKVFKTIKKIKHSKQYQDTIQDIIKNVSFKTRQY